MRIDQGFSLQSMSLNGAQTCITNQAYSKYKTFFPLDETTGRSLSFQMTSSWAALC